MTSLSFLRRYLCAGSKIKSSHSQSSLNATTYSKWKINLATLLFPITKRRKNGRLTQTNLVASSNYRYNVLHTLNIQSFRKSRKSFTTRQRIATVWGLLTQRNKINLFYAKNLTKNGFMLLNCGHKNECTAFSPITMT